MRKGVGVSWQAYVVLGHMSVALPIVNGKDFTNKYREVLGYVVCNEPSVIYHALYNMSIV